MKSRRRGEERRSLTSSFTLPPPSPCAQAYQLNPATNPIGAQVLDALLPEMENRRVEGLAAPCCDESSCLRARSQLMPSFARTTRCRRGKLVVVFAGYQKQMEGLLAHNEGLPSRFNLVGAGGIVDGGRLSSSSFVKH
jgi:hypothetical protein